MSTNHTPNYNLSLWEASDQAQRTEFNENHAKIDAILSEAYDRAGMKLIQEVPYTGTPTRSAKFIMDPIDWSAYSIVCLDVVPITDTGGPVDVKFDHITVGYLPAVNLDNAAKPQTGLIFIFPMFHPERQKTYITCGFTDPKTTLHTLNYSYATSVTLSVASNYYDVYLVPGTVVRFWGMK